MYVQVKIAPFSFEATFRGSYFVVGTDSPAINTLISVLIHLNGICWCFLIDVFLSLDIKNNN